jgi:dTDP-glucose 4,6-dehydratase
MSRCVLITGGAGFIGGALVRQILAETDWFVVNLDKMTYAANPDLPGEFAGNQRHRFIQADIADEAAVRGIFASERPDAVMHLAAETHVDRSIDGPKPFLDTNITGSFVLLEAALRHWKGLQDTAKDAFRFLHVSTDEVFGSLPENGSFDEDTPYAPNSPYSASKAASDHLARAWHRTFDLPVMVSNCSNNYGPNQFPEKLIPLMIIKAERGEKLPVYGDGQQIRDWLHVADHARALRTILTGGRPGESYNVGARCERTNLSIVEAICDRLDAKQPLPSGQKRRSLITFVTDRPGHDRRYAMKPDKIEQELGWRPQLSFDRGLAETVDWYLNHAAWWQGIMTRRYAGERLGLTQPAPAKVS